MMSAQLSNAPANAVADAVSATLGSAARSGGSVLTAWSERLTLRRELRRLLTTDSRLLRDAGFDVVWAAAEIDKPFWRA